MEKLFWTKETLKKCRLFREQKWNVLKTKWKSIMEHNKMKCSQNKWRCSKKKYYELRNNNCFENKIKCFKKKAFWNKHSGTNKNILLKIWSRFDELEHIGTPEILLD